MPNLFLIPGSILSAFISLFSRQTTIPQELPPIQPPVDSSTSCPFLVDLENYKSRFNAHGIYLKTKILGQKTALSDDDIQYTMSLIQNLGYNFEFKDKDSLSTYERDLSILSLTAMVNHCIQQDIPIYKIVNNSEHQHVMSNFNLL